jgi:hypothetical protein
VILNWRARRAFRRRCLGSAFSHRKFEVLVASLAISLVPAQTLRSPTAGIGTELIAPREKIEVTRNGAPFERSPVPMGRAIAAIHAQFAHFHGERLKPETRWRSAVNSNSRATLEFPAKFSPPRPIETP